MGGLGYDIIGIVIGTIGGVKMDCIREAVIRVCKQAAVKPSCVLGSAPDNIGVAHTGSITSKLLGFYNTPISLAGVT
jgi:hypothetical protein